MRIFQDKNGKESIMFSYDDDIVHENNIETYKMSTKIQNLFKIIENSESHIKVI